MPAFWFWFIDQVDHLDDPIEKIGSDLNDEVKKSALQICFFLLSQGS